MDRRMNPGPAVFALALALTASMAAPTLADEPPPFPRTLEFRGTQAWVRGRPVVFTGYGNYGAFFNDYDYASFLDELSRHGVNYTRQWVCPIPTDWGSDPVQPIARRPDGRFDFDRPDPVFWGRFHRFLSLAGARDIVVQVTIWDRVSIARGAYFAKNPLNRDLGGWLPAVRGAGTPHFYSDRSLRERQKAYTQHVVREVLQGGHWNVILEVMNEPIAGPAADVEAWHRACYGWIREVSPEIPILINPVDRGARLVPTPADPRVDAISFHGTQWADEVDTAAKVAALVRRWGKPVFADDDGLWTGPLVRDWNPRVHALALGALAGGAAGFDHRDDEPADGAALDRQALAALAAARRIHEAGEPVPSALVRRERFGVAESPDLEVGPRGSGWIVFLAGRSVRALRRDGDGWRAAGTVSPADNRQKRFNLPRVAIVRGVPHVVFGVDSRPGNGLFHSVLAGRGWSRATPFAGGEQVESFDATDHRGRLDVVASSIAGRARLVRYRLAGGDRFVTSEVLASPDRELRVTSGPSSLRVVGRFRFVREIEIPDAGGVRDELFRGIQGDSAGSPVEALGPGGRWLAWVGWTRADRTTWYPSGVHVRDPRGRVHTIARFGRDDLTTASIDAVADANGRLHLVYDAGGLVRRAVVGRERVVRDEALAAGGHPRIALVPGGFEVAFAGGLPGAILVSR